MKVRRNLKLCNPRYIFTNHFGVALTQLYWNKLLSCERVSESHARSVETKMENKYLVLWVRNLRENCWKTTYKAQSKKANSCEINDVWITSTQRDSISTESWTQQNTICSSRPQHLSEHGMNQPLEVFVRLESVTEHLPFRWPNLHGINLTMYADVLEIIDLASTFIMLHIFILTRQMLDCCQSG